MSTPHTREFFVKEFLNFSRYPSFELAWGCLGEEFLELKEAAEEYAVAETEETRANLVKELADVQYVLSQLAIYYDINLEEAFLRVAENNMTKVVDGKVIYRESDGKILKPDNYVKPDMTGL